jgi:transcriptional regulator with XRE-family HTH domain
MDDMALGKLFRELRVRLGWTQRLVAEKCGVSQSTYSAIERGSFARMPIATVREVAAVLEVRLVIEPRWRGAAIDRILSSKHAHMTELVSSVLIAHGWEIRPEVSFNHFGERGVVDILAWHAATRTLLIVELKTELADVNDLLGTMDRRRRLASKIAEPFAWRPNSVAAWVVVAESRTNRRRLAAVRTAVRAALPADGRAMSKWIARPDGPIGVLSFLTDSGRSNQSQSCAPRLRVRPPRPNVAQPRQAA